jgi:hypothetical protein
MATKYIMFFNDDKTIGSRSIASEPQFAVKDVVMHYLKRYNEEDLSDLRSLYQDYNAIIPITKGVQKYISDLKTGGFEIALQDGGKVDYKTGTSLEFENANFLTDDEIAQSLKIQTQWYL